MGSRVDHLRVEFDEELVTNTLRQIPADFEDLHARRTAARARAVKHGLASDTRAPRRDLS